LSQDWLGHHRSYTISNGNVDILIGPVLIRGNVSDDDSRFQKRGSAAQTCFHSDWHRAYDRNPFAWNQTTSTLPKAFPVRVHQQDRCHRGRDLNVDATAEMVQNVLEA